jgi:3',5'-cyclic AMP phosphodiesterase CpdA
VLFFACFSGRLTFGVAEDLPSADILIHSGDVAKVGSESELGDFNQWLWSIQHKFRHILVISGWA